ncbi:MAG: hypothetical protein ACLPGW_15340 [Roseiarcus sp.]
MLSNLLSPDNRGLQIVVIAGLVVAIALVLVVIYRVAFGHRLRVPGGSRARQPRLGLVDAFSLDGQRQLVLVRRDNIEHLIMIGGPNDILVESQIIRAAASPLARERDAAAVKALPMTPARVAEGAPAVAIETPPAPPELGPQPPRIAPRIEPPPIKPAPARAAFRAGVGATPAMAPAKPAPVPAPPATPEPAVAKPEPVAARHEPVVARHEPVMPKPEAVAPRPDAAPPPKPAAPVRPAYGRAPLPPPIVVAPAAKPRATPVAPPPAEIPPAQPDAGRSPPAETPAPAFKPTGEDPFADLESLEAEMARLLGRDV